jgi:hypothetical protein
VDMPYIAELPPYLAEFRFYIFFNYLVVEPPCAFRGCHVVPPYWATWHPLICPPVSVEVTSDTRCLLGGATWHILVHVVP